MNNFEMLESAFRELYSIAWENAPDADKELLSDFELRVENAKDKFNKAMALAKAGHGYDKF